ncbi:MAG: GreA/GreB family elongation factor [Candidatus Saccharimonadales bacterium]
MNTTITAKHNTILLSKKGMKELRKAIALLEHDRQSVIRGLHDIDKSTGHDDRLARIEQLARLEAIEAELVDKHQTLNNARLLPSKRARMKVAIGSVVDLIDQQGQLVRYTLVDTIEANPSDGRISVVSPLGSNLVGKTVKDIVEWSSGIQNNTLRLIRIN